MSFDDLETLSPQKRQVWQACKNFALGLSIKELQKELQISKDKGDQFRAECFQILIKEAQTEEKE